MVVWVKVLGCSHAARRLEKEGVTEGFDERERHFVGCVEM